MMIHECRNSVVTLANGETCPRCGATNATPLHSGEAPMTDTRRAEFVRLLDATIDEERLRAEGLGGSPSRVRIKRARVIAAYNKEVQGAAAELAACVQHVKELREREAATAVQGGEPIAFIYADDLAELEHEGSATVYQQRQEFAILPKQEPAAALYTAPPAARQDEGRDAARYRHIKADTSLAWICLMRREPDEWDAEIDAAMSEEAK